MIRAAIFDFDGTLTELTLDFARMRVELEKIILAYSSQNIIDTCKGLFMLELIYRVEETLGERGRQFRDEAFMLLREIEVGAATGKELYPFTRMVLTALRLMNVRTGIMTRNCTDAVKKIFPDYSEYVDVIISREEARLVKPHPSHPLALLRSLGTIPSEALLVGDHPTDVEAGVSAGVRTVGVLSGGVEREELARAGSDYVIQDIPGVPAIVKSINS
jgi:phosphoglycolate phosphatase